MIIGIVAVDKNQGIGFEGKMPWPYLDSDLQWFKDSTEHNVVIMGSVTWQSLKNPLLNRINVVVSSNLQINANITYDNPVEAVQDSVERYPDKDIYIIGGQAVYDATKHLCEKFYVTEIDALYECDKFFNLDYVKNKFTVVDELFTIDATESTPRYTVKEYKHE
jgi:dihydrofolate reductase